MVQLLLGYTAVVLGLFVLSAVMTSLSTTLSGFGVFFSACTLGVLAVWWWNEHDWGTKDAKHYKSTHLPDPALLSDLVQPDTEITGNLLAFSASAFAEKDLFTLKSRAATLTERISAVYPLVAREDIHKIVWMVMVEMCHEQTQTQISRHPLSEKAQSIK
jgi:hypothetical protein